ncbi:hypothetical protein A2865_01435 [Candidatus Woesebacteria bacterium RIFCSPHIGHO2_01_FULL_39_17]|uniref:Uncharacterized protein n=3 Tax=Candidatus Woeseibacteriota TaxID=1752722 RepID=A0A0G0QT13_9BACT|nr:MAG: hypothetical protein US72_C0014G0049 [Microgenomates group bacterium GW2011_GWC1_38_12]KKQ93558.1 MAG: hypothetical protein UT19_C0010G0002 [Candidatus Woesebacteria bacterium GW2011_GWB1_39_10b]KKR13505.1 MAG: hypothetical protein UT40_C0015G0002 [Candidatus Woesebacteria bacterium GW2011_GWA1_39_21b]OGM22860.1 MAG: hypothetical protein A2865_01435 [Candidatus Woesebacteria bacterium RIFCSPHIGHO2_01_FULL_39_17]OGM61913.1 MAG: hypothetical protein A3A52_00005 [Candidatus Woesebacteria b
MNSTKMLQTLIDGQVSIREDIKEVKVNLEKTENRLTKRIDKLGLELAELSDDAPTIREFGKFEKRVSKLETRAIKN